MIGELEKINMMEEEEESKIENSIIHKIEESCIFLEEIEKLKKQQEYVPLDIEILIT